MRKQVVIRVAEAHAPYEASWLVLDQNQGEQPAVMKHGTLEEAAQVCEGVKATILVPASAAFLATVPMPTSNKRRIMSAVPYALEDQLTEDIDDLHFCIGKRNEQGLVNTAIVSQRQMQAWLQILRDLNIQFDCLTSEIFALPYEDDHWTLLLEDQSALLRTGPESGYSIDIENIDMFLKLSLEAASEARPQTLDVYDARTQNAVEIQCEDVEINMHALHEPAISVMGNALPKANFDLNFLQGEYSRKEQLGKIWRPWIPAAALAGALFVISMAATVVENIRLENRADALQQQMEQLYLAAFPGAREQKAQGIIESETKRRLTELRGGGAAGDSDFLLLLGKAGERFSKTPGLELQRISYRAGKLDVAVEIDSLQTLDALKQQLMEDKSLAVEIQSATSRNDKVSARMQIEKGGA